MSGTVSWSRAGNPVAYCPWCLFEHEWTVRQGDLWRCAEAEGVRTFMEDELVRGMNAALDADLFLGRTGGAA